MFGCIVAGRIVQTAPQQVSDSKYLFLLENGNTINHLVVFLTGTTPLPAGFGAGIYFGWPPYTDWRFLGYMSNEKPSIVFKVGGNSSGPQTTVVAGGVVEVDMGTAEPNVVVQLGISIEPLAQLEMQDQQKKASSRPAPAPTDALVAGGSLVLTPQEVVKFVQRTLKHMQEYVMSFSVRPAGAIVESIPTEVFVKWFQNYSAKLQKDPTFWKNEPE
ncbi:hypothetical protein PROFUN_11561 [Planoprotostelium fungivorum]|uniref:Uncharacterized protein n=1 Tax=Planoprotostelium fungivorum TaxID=1890364 RepID=A0A2P6N9H7_9EUKA|nr:hypothetical protein PROFUN_11561 [Planoprotostelium fungivorum]